MTPSCRRCGGESFPLEKRKAPVNRGPAPTGDNPQSTYPRYWDELGNVKLCRSALSLALWMTVNSWTLSRFIPQVPLAMRFRISTDGGHAAHRHDENASDRVPFDDRRHPSDGQGSCPWCSFRADRPRPPASGTGGSGNRPPRGRRLYLWRSLNLAAMAGLMKDFFDRTYYPALDRISGRPYAVLICAGSDGHSAARQLARCDRVAAQGHC